MSRIGKNPIPIPKGVQVSVADGVVQVKGPKGALKHPCRQASRSPSRASRSWSSARGDEPDVRALHGLVRALLANAVSGVTAGFKRELDIVGVGFKAELKNPREIVLSLGFSHPVVYKAPGGRRDQLRRQGQPPDHRGDRQAEGRPGGGGDSQRAPARRVQGQGCQVRGRGPEAQGREDRSVAPWLKSGTGSSGVIASTCAFARWCPGARSGLASWSSGLYPTCTRSSSTT